MQIKRGKKMNNKFRNEIETLKQLPKIIENFVKNIPNGKLDVKRNESSWTIREHLNHIIQVQKMFMERIRKIKIEKKPVIEPFFPDNDNLEIKNVEMKELFKIYKNYRKKQIKEIKNCTKKEFNKKAEHGEYTEYSIPILIRHIIFHEFWHMYRIEEILYIKDEYFE